MSEQINKLEQVKKLKNGKGVQYLLNTAYEVLGNPIYMIDVGYNLLAKTENTVTDDELWNELSTKGVHSHDTIHLFKTEDFFSIVEKADKVVLLKSDKFKYNRIVGKLFDENSILIGDIVVVECYKPFRFEDYRFIKAICKFMTIELRTSKLFPKITRLLHKTFIGDLIDGNITDSSHNITASIKKNMEKLYRNLKKNLYVGVVDISHYDPTFGHVAYFRNLFEQMQNEYEFFDYMYNVGIIISTDNYPLIVKRDLNILNDFLKKFGIYAGISSRFDNPYEIKKYYKQAISALNIGTNEKNSQSIFMYDDFLLDNILNVAKHEIKLSHLCHPLVSLIQKIDRENNTNYFNIMYRYLVDGRNSYISAAKMGMDHNKFCNSIREIENMCEIDWNNGNVIASILMSFKILGDISDV